ncbi:MAG: 30S ribosomal protein S9 [Candidatus Stahlbacteria bacterium]|nr:30S ribosomal protein S9 [Candidatus Stahlbacteria bacterium]
METIYAIGKRKRAVAQVTLKEGNGEIKVNGKNPNDYFGRDDLLRYIESPLKIIKSDTQFNVTATVMGGGISGQAGALALGISRALLKVDADNRKVLKSNGLLRRDPREKERRKCGRKKARKSFQWTKR